MKSLLVIALAGACAALPAHAQTFRWASQGDAQTMDPVSQNEGLTNSINQMVYERLIRRDIVEQSLTLGFAPLQLEGAEPEEVAEEPQDDEQ